MCYKWISSKTFLDENGIIISGAKQNISNVQRLFIKDLVDRKVRMRIIIQWNKVIQILIFPKFMLQEKEKLVHVQFDGHKEHGSSTN